MAVTELLDLNLNQIHLQIYLYVFIYPMTVLTTLMTIMFLLAKISQIINEFQTPYVYVCGDFNANTRWTSQFGDELSPLCRCNVYV